jgi:hypothetical protein
MTDIGDRMLHRYHSPLGSWERFAPNLLSYGGTALHDVPKILIGFLGNALDF